MKVCVLGAGGLLGHMLIRVLGATLDVYGTTRESRSDSSPLARFLPQDKWIDNIEASKFDSINKVFGTTNFDTVINCIGLIKQRNAQTTEHEMMLINAEFPHRLAQAANQQGVRVIHISTDCVFSGDKGSYTETDTKDPIDNYGYSKVLGEHQDKNLITLRCSLVGKELNSKIEFLEWVLSHGEGSEVGGFTDHLWNGLTTMHYAKIISGLMKRNHFSAGTFHIVPEDSVSKYQLSQIILECFGSSHINVVPIQSPKSVNRTLATDNVQFNLDMWRDAGYNKPLNVAEMIREYSLWV